MRAVRSIAILIPDLVILGGESVLRQSLPGLGMLAPSSRVVGVKSSPAPVCDWEFLGGSPLRETLAEGPLTVAAFGVDPPARSVHFHLSLLSAPEGSVLASGNGMARLSDAERTSIVRALERLDTERLRLVPGEGSDHALVWLEGSLDMGTTEPSAAIGQPWLSCAPQGDGEPMFRRYIDDSINLLSGLDANRRLVDEGFDPVNVAWPWGQGFRPAIPNLALRIGERVRFDNARLRRAGLARLAGYDAHRSPAWGNGINTKFAELRASLPVNQTAILVADGLSELRRHRRDEEAAWWMNELDLQLIQPLAQAAVDDRLQLLIAGGEGGLAMVFDFEARQTSTMPFDERALEESRLPRQPLWELLQQFIVSAASRRLSLPSDRA